MAHRACSVGLTGGLASGKSTVADLLRRHGIPVLDADRIVHRLYEAGGAGAAVVLDLFGDAALAADGSVDRAALAAAVVHDADARSRLNDAVHPLVRAEIDRWLAARGDPIAVVEAALLVETGSFARYDLLMVVRCDPEQQFERAVDRGVDEDRALALIAAQAPFDDKVAKADVVVDNSGDREALEAEVERAWAEVERLCRGRKPGP